MALTLEYPYTPEAVAEVFWLAFRSLPEVEQRAVLERLLQKPVPRLKTKLAPQPADHLLQLSGIVALGGDAVEDSERLYDLDTE
jgi:hypothetical protein